jgi:signal-transduction protein with cAMP-binding, CBS, and nucleotidyltransferase domain
MDHPLRSPEEILAYRSLKQMLRPGAVWSANSADSVLSAARTMAEKNTGFLVVLENAKLVGVLSERDCIRRVMLAGRSPEVTPVADIMVQDVITANLKHTFVDCLRLMHTHGIRHLPIVDNDRVVGVISVRDLLREAVEHHARVISELERERMMMTTSTA